ncbi:hypothetical protein OG709_33480 [Streptomyces sp. NBC_01267]|uniref:hypothetical protein n=1 Tax=unclassified Streptomyces TaxID=2593676 RepID=UPI0020241F78|nr:MULTISPECIES: hypothetical protein [unclassified Streptomyces]MCX4553451.1 hypothetical protein [Streptomyces sp. NBC_01500]WSV52451.1 hypothetical protein OG282_01480 [Streptomyces sp. NBC_01014]
MDPALVRTGLTAAVLCATLAAGAATPGVTPDHKSTGAAPPRAAAPRTEGDTNPPPLNIRTFTEQTVDLTWAGTTEAGRDRICAHPHDFTSPALDSHYAAKLIEAKCRTHR